MIEFNHRGVWKFLLIAFMFMLAAWVVMQPVHADNIGNITVGNTTFINMSYVIVETIDGPVNITTSNTTLQVISPHYIEQGDIVYIGDTIDISGVVPPYPQLAYWNGYDMYDSVPTYNITMSQRKSSYYSFFVDPDTFGSRIGKWYKYADKFERQGNNLAFIVLPRPFFNYTMTFPNGTVMYVSEIPELQRVLQKPLPEPEIMPWKPVADYLVTSDAALNITVSELTAAWIFDPRDNSILYSVNTSGNQIIFSEKQIGGLETGEYKILLQTVGKSDNNLDVVYSDNAIKWFDRETFTVHEIPTRVMVPDEVIRNLQRIIPLTHDSYVIKRLAVQDPEITIGYMEQVGIGSAKEYYDNPDLRGNVSLMEIRGYTNVFPGTPVSVTLDETKVSPREVSKLYTYRSTAQGTWLGDMRYYRVYVPLYWDSLAPGMHNLTARTELGGFTVANFPVNEDHPDSYVPEQKIRFMGDRNPWVPTPTPEVIVKTEQVVETQTVHVPVPPSDAQISEAAQMIVDKQNRELEVAVVIGTMLLLALAFIGWFVYSIWRAKKK